jgi:RHS repeat-associated protein
MTVAGNDSFTWDYANRMTGATVGGTATTYAYAGDGVRASKTVGGNTTSYVWDRESGLPVAVDDGTNRYMHADGLIAEIDGANAARYHLGDALGSVRGMADGAGALVATASYDVYGAVRATTGTESVFGYTGEQRDAETGFTYLRARYLNPALGRFMSADSVQPNAPGTQGYNLYAYVANNPATWVDPSGHSVAGAAMLGMVMADPGLMYALMAACLVAAGAAAGATAGAGAGAAASGAGTVAWQATPWVGLAAAVCIVAISTTIGIPAIICALDPACVGQATEWAESFAQTTATAIIEIVRQLKCRLVPPVLFIPLHVLNKMATKHAPGATMRDWIANPTGNFDTKNSEFNTSNKFLLAGYVEAAAMAGVGKWHESGASCRLHQMMLWEVGTTNWEDGWMPTRCLRVVLAPYSMYAVNSSYPVPESYCR